MPPAAEMIGSFRFSTGCLPVSERATAVRELRERGILPVEPLPDRALRVQQQLALGGADGGDGQRAILQIGGDVALDRL